jgi:hypothetical protein
MMLPRTPQCLSHWNGQRQWPRRTLLSTLVIEAGWRGGTRLVRSSAAFLAPRAKFICQCPIPRKSRLDGADLGFL